jgi:two-component system NarL family sensor kinase
MDPNETKIYSAFLIAAFILGVFFIFFIVTILRHQRKNQQLYKEKILVEINTLESERSRIASDLHDDLGPTLSSVKLLINNVALASRADEVSILKANEQIDSILQRVRTISNNLMPQALIRKGLKTAVDELVSEMNEQEKMEVRFFLG